MSKIAFASALLTAFFSSSIVCAATDFFPDTGRVALTQHALELREHLHVASIAVRPGEEDCATLAYLRMGRGAQVTSIYLTNGEQTELDNAEVLPFDVAVTRRVEASKAMEYVGADPVFLNLGDPGAPMTADSLRRQWNADTLEAKLRRVLEATQPDFILLMSDKRDGETSGVSRLLKETLQHAAVGMRSGPAQVLLESRSGSSTGNLMQLAHPVRKVSYKSIGDSAGSQYASITSQRQSLSGNGAGKYSVLFPRGKSNLLLQPNAPADRRMPDSLKGLDKSARDLAAFAMRPSVTRNALVARILPVLQAVDRGIVQTAHEESREHRILLDWKEALEQLRCAALGVHVKYSLEYSVLCERQLVRLGFEEIHANVNLSALEVFLPEVARGWIANEALRSRIPVKEKDTLRLISPEKIDYDFPLAANASVRTTLGRLFPVVLVHAGRKKEETFVYRFAPRIFFAPRFTAESLTPIVRAFNGERVITRLTNHSRDGVADRLLVGDSLVTSPPARVALSWKESAKIDTLTLQWRDSLADGTYMASIIYGGLPVSRFIARRFSCPTDTSRFVGVISPMHDGALREALRRLACPHVVEISAVGVNTENLRGFRTVFLDRRALSLCAIQPAQIAALRSFVDDGGHLVILAQEPGPWNASGLWEGLRVGDPVGLPPAGAVVLASGHQVLSVPNRITADDFGDWLQRRCYHRVTLSGDTTAAQVLVKTTDGMPLMVTRTPGKGRMTYTDLALGPQWMNVSVGAFRLLANLVAQ